MSAPAIAIELRLSAGSFVLDVAFASEAGVVAVLGSSGSGKTSLLECVAGLRRGVVGRVRVGEAWLLDTARGVRLAPERRRVGYVPQDGALFPHLSVRDNIGFGVRAGARPGFDDLVSMLELGSLLGRYPASLSGGERQRVALARALVTAPRILLLDEPLASLDTGLRERILPYLLRLRTATDVTMLYVTHNAGEAAALAGDALVLRAGAVVACGPAAVTLSAERLAADPGAVLENVLAAELVRVDAPQGTAVVRLADGVDLVVSAAEVDGRVTGDSVVLTVGAQELLLATAKPEGVSARNVFAGVVEAVEPAQAFVLVHARVGENRWQARVTAAAVRELALAAGRPVWLVVKAQALRRLR